MKKIILCLLFSFTIVQAKNANRQFIDEALKSNDIDQHIVAGLLAKSFELPYTNQQLYRQAFKLDPNNILLLESLIRFCNDKDLICQQKDKYLKRLVKQDSKNAIPNLYSIVHFGNNKQYPKALKQLKKAVNKKVFNDYNFKRFFLVDKVLKSYGYSSSQAKKTASKSTFIDFNNEPIVKIINLCVNQSKINSQWIEQCIAMGKVMETSSTMILSTFIGYAIQRDVLALDKNREIEFENVKHRRDVFHQFRLRVFANIKYASLSEETKFDEVPEIFYKEYQKFGERVALQRALDRLKDKEE